MNKKKKIIIAIDGYSSCGKSTLAKQLAKSLEYIYVDTGAMYRAVTLYCIQKKWMHEGKINIQQLIEGLEEIKVSFEYNNKTGVSETFLNGENIEVKIRGLEVSGHVSKVAKIPEVRKKMVAIQQDMGKEKGLIMDGRDIGSVVFPKAELKIFMTASLEIRVKRRYDELKEKGNEEDYEKVLKNIRLRDGDDISRENNPLVQAEDAIVLDNSFLSQQEQFAKILNMINAILENG